MSRSLDEAIAATDAEGTYALNGGRYLALLRCLSQARAALEEAVGPRWCSVCGVGGKHHGPECKIGNALAAIAALFPEEKP